DAIQEDARARPGGLQGLSRVRPEGLQGRGHSGQDQGAHRPRDRTDHPVSLVHRRPHEEGRDGRCLGRGDCRDDLRRDGDGRRGRVEPRRAGPTVLAGAQGLIDDLRSHIGRAQTATDVLHPGPANALRLTLGRAEPEYREGDPLPPAWLALYFLPRVVADALRPDGSPRDTGVVPPVPLSRRMFAGQRVRVHRQLRLGESVRRETGLADITLKRGGTGTLVFATVTTSVFGAAGLTVEEERRTMFRDEVKPGESNQAPRREPAPTDVPWRRRVTPDPVMLFRYSPLTFNSHRIHYDRAWAMDLDGYPGLVVHGLLPATLLAGLARDQPPGRRVGGYTTQARAPLFDNASVELRGRPAGGGRCELWAVTPEGAVAMSAEVELA